MARVQDAPGQGGRRRHPGPRAGARRAARRRDRVLPRRRLGPGQHRGLRRCSAGSWPSAPGARWCWSATGWRRSTATPPRSRTAGRRCAGPPSTWPRSRARAVPLIVAGDSAGGNLAAVVARRRPRADGPQIALQVLIYPVTDCDLGRLSYTDPANQLLLTRSRWPGSGTITPRTPPARLHPDASPLRAPDLSGLPPAVVMTAEHDVLRDEGELYATRLIKAGVPVRHRRFDGQMHGFFTMVGMLPGSEAALEYVADALAEQLGALGARPGAPAAPAPGRPAAGASAKSPTHGGPMSRRDLIDPERGPLDPLLAVMPGGFNAIPDIVAAPGALDQLLGGMELPPNPDVASSEDRVVPGPAGEPDITLRIYRPAHAPGPRAGHLLHPRRRDDPGHRRRARTPPRPRFCDQVGAAVVSVEYRLAPEHPHPAPVEDCYAGLDWTARQRRRARHRPGPAGHLRGQRGGGLAIATALLARDRGFPALCFQMPIYPMIDDRQRDRLQPRDHRHRHLGPRGQHRGLAVVPRRRQGRTITRPRRAPRTCPGCRRPSSTSAPSTCSGTRTSLSPRASCTPGSRPSCTSIPAPTTARRASRRRPRCPGGSWRRRIDALRRALA